MSKGKTWYALGLLFAINLLNFYDRIIPSAVGKLIRDDLSLSNTAYGAIGTAFIVLYALIGIPLGRMSDKANRSRVLAVGVTIWSIMTAASGLAVTYWQILWLRLGVGVGEAACAPAANSMIGDLFPAKRRAMALSLFMLGLPLGNTFGLLLSGEVAKAFENTSAFGFENLGWRAAFLVALIPGLLCGIGALFLVEPNRGATEEHSIGAATRQGNPFLVVLSIPTMRWLIAAGAFHNFIMYGVGTYLTMDAMQYHSLDVRQANYLSAIVYGATGIPGMILGGMLGDMIYHRRKNGRLLVAAIAMTLAAPCLWLGLNQAANAWMAYSVLFGFGCMLLYVYFATVYSSIQDVIEPSLRGTAMAVYFCFMYLFGGMLGPIGVGYISDHFVHAAAVADNVNLDGTQEEVYQLLQTYEPVALHQAMYSLSMAALALGLVLFAASYTVTKDTEKLRQWMQSQSAVKPARPEPEKVTT